MKYYFNLYFAPNSAPGDIYAREFTMSALTEHLARREIINECIKEDLRVLKLELIKEEIADEVA